MRCYLLSGILSGLLILSIPMGNCLQIINITCDHPPLKTKCDLMVPSFEGSDPTKIKFVI